MIRYGRPERHNRWPTDRRYDLARWQRVRNEVKTRANGKCYVADCTKLATVADHIRPVYPGMPDILFFGLSNLRASCHGHNVSRRKYSGTANEARFFATEVAPRAGP